MRSAKFCWKSMNNIAKTDFYWLENFTLYGYINVPPGKAVGTLL